jgi:hypothetical protein
LTNIVLEYAGDQTTFCLAGIKGAEMTLEDGMSKTVAECNVALEAAYRVLEEANRQNVPAREWLIYQDRAVTCRADLAKAQMG